MGDRDYLSELEQLVLLSVLRLGANAYGAAIQRDLEAAAGRSVAIATIYVALTRMERKGLVRSWMSEPAPVRGGRAKRFYEVAEDGRSALAEARATMDRMWEGVPAPSPEEAR